MLLFMLTVSPNNKPSKDHTHNKQEGSYAHVCMYDAALRLP